MVFKRTDSDLSVYLSERERKGSFSEEKLFFILRRAMFKTNFFPEVSSFRVKASVLRGGGMRVTFTPILREKASICPLIFRFYCLDDLYDAAEFINKKYSLFVFKSQLFKSDRYVLIIYPLASLDSSFYKDMAEYSEFLGSSETRKAYFDEHAVCLENKNAIEKLCF